MLPRQRRRITAVIVTAVLGLWWGWPQAGQAEGASLKISPSTGVYEVGGLVDISFLVDTGGQAINTVQADILFPADKLQVVNPVASTSFISLWVSTPTYSNTDGTIHFQGGLPTPGIKTSSGVISTVTFRIKAAGLATVRYATTSRVLLNDGAGTNILASTGTADFTLKNPPPAGPITTSPTHPDSSTWFNNPQVQFQWEAVEGAVGYSYSFDQSPKSVPDDTIDTTATAVNVKATGDGAWYFHVRALAAAWGGVTTVTVLIDATAPAQFNPKFDHATVTVEDSSSLRFITTDAASGIDHYELKQVSSAAGNGTNSLFIEVTSPYTGTPQPAGKYEYVVRAFDRAGNATEGSAMLNVVASGLPFFARVPLLQNPAVANIVLLVLGVLAVALVSILVIRHFRLRANFEHDLVALERDAAKKSRALERELEELRRAQDLVNRSAPPPPSPPPQP